MSDNIETGTLSAQCLAHTISTRTGEAMELLVTRLVQVRAPRGFCSSTWPTLQHAEGCGMLTHTCGLNVHEQKDMAIGGLFRFCMDSPRPHQRPRVPASDEETGHHAGR